MKFIICLIVGVCVFCATEDQNSFEIRLSPLGLPLLMLCNKYQLLVDTGSQEVWMADNSCQTCLRTLQLCPHLTKASNKIEYFQGEVMGDMTYLNTCLGSHKIFCVKQSKGMESLSAVGILGIKGRSSGKKLILSMLENANLSGSSISFYFGVHEAKMILGQIPQKYTKEELSIENDGQLEWHIAFFGLQINKSPEIKCASSLFFDTGSNILALPTSIYQPVISLLTQVMLSKKCIIQQSPITFVCEPNVDLNDSYILLRVSSNQNDSLLHLSLTDLIDAKERKYSLLIRENSKNVVLVGISVFKDHIVQFSMDGSLRLFRNNIEYLGAIEMSNYLTMTCGYIVILGLLSFVSTKIHQIIEQTINRKIVI